MTPTWAEIYEQVRTLLADDDTPGGQIFTDAYLAIQAKGVTESIFRAFDRYSLPYVQKETFVRVPSYTSYVDLATAGINSGGTVNEVWCKEPEFITDIPLSPAPSNDPTTGFVRLQPFDLSGFTTGDLVEVILDRRFYGVVNDTWTITVDSPYIILNGCLAQIKAPADYSGAAPGYVSKGGTWRQLVGPDLNWNPDDRGEGGQGSTSKWALRGQALRLWPVNSQVQVLSVKYGVTGEMDMENPDAVVQLDDSLMLYANAIAGVAGQNKGQTGIEKFLVTAYGPTMQPTGEGGILGGFVDRMIKDMQQSPQIKGRFAPRNWNRGFLRNQTYRNWRSY